MKKFIATVATAGVLLMGTGSSASAGAPTCQNERWRNHGEHITEDYVRADGSAGGGAPAHFGSSARPGASFCLDQAQSKPISSEGHRA